ncbi:MAG: glycerophosphodiester phosphodiesterase [Calditrichaeota bacterium]|nr:glycerophosphodiester phosphodiesterase [Calditrichota bacterium]
MRDRAIVLGHRGSPKNARENTLDSFRTALDEGADGVELDVQVTRDGVPVVFHDDCFVTGEKLRELTYADMREVAHGLCGHVHTLDEVLRELSGKGFVNIEVKHAGYEEAILGAARKVMPKETFLFSSFLPDVVQTFRTLAPDVPAIWIVAEAMEFEQALDVVRKTDARGIAFWHELITEQLAGFFQIHNVPLFTWTVNDVEEFRRVVGLGVAGVITDDPARIVAAK